MQEKTGHPTQGQRFTNVGDGDTDWGIFHGAGLRIQRSISLPSGTAIVRRVNGIYLGIEGRMDAFGVFKQSTANVSAIGPG
jgi:hypothetical protein